MEPAAGASADADKSITVNVKFSARSIPVTLPAESTIKDLKLLLQPLTNVLPRGQKIIFKGKVLADEMTLSFLEIKNGAKLMLLASHGLHQGDGPTKKEDASINNLRRIAEVKVRKEHKNVCIEKSQLDRWKATGVIALSECDLKVIPNEVWNVGHAARVLDLNHNSIQDVPATIRGLSSLQKLLLNTNYLLDEAISWDGISSLTCLSILSLDKNLLTILPPALGALTCLKQLHLSKNQLTSLPPEIGHLVQLQVLEANNNRISSIPLSVGNCSSLVEVNLSSNLLLELPETFGNLQNLKALHLNNNGLKSLPSTLLKNCIQLSTLELHGTEITMDILRQFEGWESFDSRRQLKHQKQLAFRVEGSAYFDEGADKS